MDKNTTRHSERSEESSITRYKTGNVIASIAWQSRHYVINSFRKLAYGKGFYWILRCAQNDGYARKLGFTMAEILLSLTIIGVVAAITLPSLTGNINEKTWNAQRKALYARMSQAVALMESLNGYGIGATESETASNAAKAFITNGLAKVYKINNICDAEHLSDCGIPDKITKQNVNSKLNTPINMKTLNGIITNGYDTFSYSQINTYAAAFETANGESIVTYYYPYCRFFSAPSMTPNDYYNFIQPSVCANFIYDLNGKKGPNTVGKDIGIMTVFYPTDSVVVAPVFLKALNISKSNSNPNFTIGLGNSSCRTTLNNSAAKMANIEELSSLFVNQNLINGANTGVGTLSSSHVSGTDYVYSLKMYSGSLSVNTVGWYVGGSSIRILCVE